LPDGGHEQLDGERHRVVDLNLDLNVHDDDNLDDVSHNDHVHDDDDRGACARAGRLVRCGLVSLPDCLGEWLG